MAVYVVQSAQGTAVTATGTVTLPAATRAGNTLVAMASVRNAGASSATLSNVTLAGVQDNFAQLATFGPGLPSGRLYWWLDPLCAGGQTQVVFTTTGGAGTEALTMDVLEIGGLLPLAAGAAVDQSSSGTAATAAWNSGTTSLTAWPVELFLGGVTAGGASAITGPSYPWINLPSQPNGTISITQFGYAAVAASVAQTFSGTFAASQSSVAGVISIPGMTAAPTLPSYVAGQGMQQGDAFSVLTSPLLFIQERVVFRAAQVNTTTTLLSGNQGPITTLQLDTVYEDPWGGWNPSTFAWKAPVTGWYQLTAFVSVNAPSAGGTTIYINMPGVVNGICAAVVNSVGFTTLQGQFYAFLIGGQDSVLLQAYTTSSSNNVSPTTVPNTFEIMWIAA